MSTQEKTFIKWFGGIAGALIIAMILGLLSFWQTSIKTDEQFREQIHNLKGVRYEVIEYHDNDVNNIRTDVAEIKEMQKEIRLDIKKLLTK